MDSPVSETIIVKNEPEPEVLQPQVPENIIVKCYPWENSGPEVQQTPQEFEFVTVKGEPQFDEVLPQQEFEFVAVKEEPQFDEVLPQQAPEHIILKEEPYGNEVDHEKSAKVADTGEIKSHAMRLAERTSKCQVTPLEGSSTSTSCNNGQHWSDNKKHCSGVMLDEHPEQIFTCEHCAAVFVSKYKITNHVFFHIGILPPPNICEICGNVFPTAHSLKEHAVVCQNKQIDVPEKKCLCQNSSGNKCDYCQKSFLLAACYRAQAQISVPESSHMGGKKPKCKICGKYFYDASCLSRHRFTHTGEKRFTCEICGKYFTQSSYLTIHKRLHTGDKPCKCDICGKSFTHHSNLAAHRRTHSGEKPHRCEVCGKSYSHRTTLIEHINVHLGEKPYKCDFCTKSFYKRYSLITHRRTHTEGKPFKCEFCGKCFTEKSSLTTHKPLHIQV